jgi:hypothetical protein
LPCYLDYRILYSYMVEDLTTVGELWISYSQFCKLMKEDFSEVSIQKVRLKCWLSLWFASTNKVHFINISYPGQPCINYLESFVHARNIVIISVCR